MPHPPRVLDLGPTQIELGSGAVRGPRPDRLTGLELALLRALLAAEGEARDRSWLLREVWGHRSDGSWRAVDAAVFRLRQKIELEPSDPRWLLSVRGGGYRLVPPEMARLPHGRDAELDQLLSALEAGRSLLITGLPGVGRSWLLDRLAERLRGAVRVDGGGVMDPTALAARIAGATGATATQATTLEALLDGVATTLTAETVLLVDDAPGAGAASVLAGLRARTPGLRTARVGDPPADDAEVMVPLLPLTEGGAQGLYSALCPGPVGDAERRIQGITAGLPLALVLAAGAARWVGADAVADALERATSAGAPGQARLGALLAAGAALLSPEGRAALAALSVPAGPFSAEDAARLLPEDGLALLSDLVARGWVLRGEGARPFRVLPLVRAWAVDALPPPDPGVLDRWRAAVLGEARSLGWPLLEYERVQVRPRLGPLAPELAALQAAPAQAGLGPEDRARVAVLLACWMEGTAPARAREAVLREALQGFAPPDPGLDWARVQLALADVVFTFGDRGESMRLLEPLVVALDPVHASPHAADPARDRLWALAVLLRSSAQQAWEGERGVLERAQAVAARLGDPALEGQLRIAVAWRRWQTADAAAGEVHALLVEAGALLAGCGDVAGAVLAELHRSTVSQESGAWDEARAARQRAAALQARTTDRRFEGALVSHASFDALAVHDMAGAEAAARRGLHILLAEGRTDARANILAHLALIRLHRGALADAVALAGQALIAAGSGAGRAQTQARVDLILALATLEQGEWAAARTLAAGAREAAEEPAATLLAGVEALAAARLGERAASAEAALHAASIPFAAWFRAACAAARQDPHLAERAAAPELDAILPGYGAIFRHRLLGSPDPEPPPPAGAAPPDERHVLLRLSRR